MGCGNLGADLHVHSVFSDGSETPERLIEIAVQKDLKTIALADHDTIEGIERAAAYGKQKGVEVIPAIELSTARGGSEIHILGYFIDYKSPLLLAEINKYFKARLIRARKMVDKLNKLGVKISYDNVEKLAGDKFVGRPHIARAMKEAGYIEKVKDAFGREYIGNRGKAYVPKYRLSPEEGISLIIKADGIPVIAHPYLINKGTSYRGKELKKLKKNGLAGIEVYHTNHPPEATQYYHKLAVKLDLLITGGSDYHGANTPGIEMGDVRLGDEFVSKLKKVHNKKFLGK